MSGTQARAYTWAAYALPLAVLLALDGVWIGGVMKTRYLAAYAQAQGGRPVRVRLPSAALAYAAMWLAFVAVLKPVLDRECGREGAGALRCALRYGAPMGLAIYGVVNATNHALLSGFDGKMAWVDALWGTFLYAATAYVYCRYAAGR